MTNSCHLESKWGKMNRERWEQESSCPGSISDKYNLHIYLYLIGSQHTRGIWD